MTAVAEKFVWTEDALETLRRYLPIEGCALVAERLGTTQMIVRHKGRRCRIPIKRLRNSPTVAEKVKILSLKAQHYTNAEIGAEMGLSIEAVRSRLRSMKLPPAPKAAKEEVAAVEPKKLTDRPCLRCRNVFQSEGRHNQCCAPCRSIIDSL